MDKSGIWISSNYLETFTKALKVGSIIRVVNKYRPESFNCSGRMDYLLDRETFVTVSSIIEAYNGKVLGVTIPTTDVSNLGEWALRLSDCKLEMLIPDADLDVKKRKGDL